MAFEDPKLRQEEKVLKVFEKALNPEHREQDKGPTPPPKDVTGGQKPLAEVVKQIVSHWTDDSDIKGAGRDKAGRGDPQRAIQGAQKSDGKPPIPSRIR